MKDDADFIRGCFAVPIFEKKIMIQQRADGTWGLFGGTRQGNEKPLDCMRREFFEETGISFDLKKTGDLEFMEHVLIYTYYPGERLMNVLPNIETMGYAWVFLDDLRSLDLNDTFEGYLDKFVKFVKPHLR